jgi:copper chaperone CopZ
MTKTFLLDEIDCPNCAAKAEANVMKIKGVESASLSFLTQKLVVSAPDEIFDSLVEDIKKAVLKVEPDCIIKML